MTYNHVTILPRSGWISVYRKNNTLYSDTSSPTINLTYIPTEGPDGNLTLNENGDLEVKSVTEMLPFLCQFSDGKFIKS